MFNLIKFNGYFLFCHLKISLMYLMDAYFSTYLLNIIVRHIEMMTINGFNNIDYYYYCMYYSGIHWFEIIFNIKAWLKNINNPCFIHLLLEIGVVVMQGKWVRRVIRLNCSLMSRNIRMCILTNVCAVGVCYQSTSFRTIHDTYKISIQ